MTRWTGIVVGLAPEGGDEMVSRIPAFLHPVAGRPLLWHAVASLAALSPRPERIVVAADAELNEEIFRDLPVPVQPVPLRRAETREIRKLLPPLGEAALVVEAASVLAPESLEELQRHPAGTWLAGDPRGAAAAWLDPEQVPALFRLPEPLAAPNGVLSAHARLSDPRPQVVVHGRAQLAAASRLVRDRLVGLLMRNGVTFLLPESVLVDVDVRIGRDTVVYPGVVLEGQTTIGEESVVGPGCRIVDSLIGSGVELKGWNYISHTSIRNRAILEPYVRRGFD